MTYISKQANAMPTQFTAQQFIAAQFAGTIHHGDNYPRGQFIAGKINKIIDSKYLYDKNLKIFKIKYNNKILKSC